MESNGEGSDARSLLSEAESDGEEPAPDSDPDGELEADIGFTGRAAKGAHTVFSNSYFLLTDNPNYPDCRMTVHRRWHDEMGISQALGGRGWSKTIGVKTLADPPEGKPVRTYLALRAWMLWKFQEQGFSTKSKGRMNWLSKEVESLRRDIALLGVHGGGTGNVQADRLIRKWCPSAL